MAPIGQRPGDGHFPMPVRDWDKLRRQDRAGFSGYRSLAGIDYSRPRKKKRKKGKGRGFLNAKARLRAYYHSLAFKRARPEPPPEPKPGPTIALTRWLQIELGSSIGTAIFTRKAGSPNWRCTSTNHPSIAWFAGMLHMDPIRAWLRSNHFAYRWLSTNPEQTVPPSCSDEVPVDPSQGTQASAVDTDPSLKNPSPTLTGIPESQNKGGSSRTGATTSLPAPSNQPPEL